MPRTNTTPSPAGSGLDRGSDLSRTFSALKWFLALTVVADHFLRPHEITFLGTTYQTGTYPGFREIYLFVFSFLKNYAVPIFFFMSGYLLNTGRDFTTAEYVPLLKRRLRRLAVPFLVWISVGLAITGPVEYPLMIRSIVGLRAFPDMNVPLWYLRDLMLALCMVPLLNILLKRIDWRIITTAAALAFLVLFNDSRGWRLEVATFFFTLGYVMRRYDVDVIALFRRMFPWSCAAYPVLGLVHLYCLDSYPEAAILAKNVNICMALPLYVYLFYIMVRKGWVKGSAFLASASFLVYVLHYPMMHVVRDAMLYLFHPADGSPWGTAVILASYLLLVMMILGLFRLMHRFFPRQLAYLTGGR